MFLLSRIRTYRIQDSGAASLACNVNSCFIFVHRTNAGWRGNYFKDLGLILRMLLGGAVPPTDMHAAEKVFEITAKNVKSYSFERDLNVFTVYKSNLYAMGDGRLWLWKGDHFEAASPELRKEYEEAGGRGLVGGPQVENYDGWYLKFSITGFGEKGKFEKTFQLDGQPVTIASSNDGSDHERIDIQRGSQPPQEIWSTDYSTRKVDQETYRRIFGKT
jgi:hypothetical protein